MQHISSARLETLIMVRSRTIEENNVIKCKQKSTSMKSSNTSKKNKHEGGKALARGDHGRDKHKRK